jgi:7,8-dihydropterin-6-yl-methyl-4-(beta-D-ribofuranosyl)aminobenzene 5'-phosphate synthase
MVHLSAPQPIVNHLRIKILVENTATGSGLLGEHGLAVWLQADDHRLLFDTGQGMALGNNSERLGVALHTLDAIALSHGHDDHTGGLQSVLAQTGPIPIYLHPDALSDKYSPRGYIGMPPASRQGLEALTPQHLVFTDKPTAIFPGVWLTGPVPRAHSLEDTGGNLWQDAAHHRPDPLLDDQTLWVNTPEGLVVVLGCAHAGVINTLSYIALLMGDTPIHTVIGGMHLRHASTARIEATADALEQLGVQHIGANHCTGTQAIAYFRQRFPDRVIDCPVGKVLEFGASAAAGVAV